ncbi:Phosphoesterase [Methylocella tundrae]|uniref:Phosphoesterase n=1 Tax=Methylocella tundrae TaxID=227605 RepID=A0A8B6MBY8_METTU|nr:ligase-associated DNA damage response endonuclease PdeM [Methylocella tundrae]VTZ27291.1 Phosphoesterase [Methylocella tundrae]VTZ51598.1 Phosphoesterase [Methylocella tundrae]
MRHAARRHLRAEAVLSILDVDFVADPLGALFWREERLLVVADLHFEKGSAFAAKGVFLPPYDTAATLVSLAQLITYYEPRCVVALGDSFHDGAAGDRMSDADRSGVGGLQRGRDWIWIAGNHDRELPRGLSGEARNELAVGRMTFRHEPAAGAIGEIAGHLHPVARVAGHGGSVRRRSFVSDGARCVLPAFGAFAGGLNLHDSAFDPLFGGPARSFAILAHVMGRNAVYRVPHRLCLPD